MGLHSTLFGPVKFAYMPQVLNERELTGGNGMVEMGDEVVFHATGDAVSGHGLKHVAAALAVWPVWSALRQNPRATGRTLASVAQ